MKQQAIRHQVWELRVAQAIRRMRTAMPKPVPSFQITWRDVRGLLAMTLVTLLFIACVLGWVAGIDGWPMWSAR